MDNASDDYIAIFGHSMGCYIAYCVARLMISESDIGSRLTHLFLAGNHAPHLNLDTTHKTEFYRIDEQELKYHLIEYGGTLSGIIENKAANAFFLPIIRNDYYITETHSITTIEPLPCSISVLNGIDDALSSLDLESWKGYTTQRFEVVNFPGNHFFVQQQSELIIQYVSNTINKYKLTNWRPQ